MRAIFSVFDKIGLVEFAKGLAEMDADIISTGGTAKHLREAGIVVTDVSEVTKFPEILDGRVKTLHPAILAGILARSTPKHMAVLREHLIKFVHLVVVNLYPFSATVTKAGVTEEEAIENIDIGGPTMLRAAAKNFERVTVVVDPGYYGRVLKEFRDNGNTSLETRRRLMLQVFKHISGYDAVVYNHFSKLWGLV